MSRRRWRRNACGPVSREVVGSARAVGVSLLALLLFVAPGTRTADASVYTITDLGTLGGGRSYAWGINASGQVVGWSSIHGDAASHAFLYDAGGMHDLGTLGGSNSYARSINDGGQIAGSSQIAGATFPHAVLFSEGVMHDLGTLSGDFYSDAAAISSSGVVVGSSGDGTDHAFLNDRAGMHALGALSGHNESFALGISASGQVVGYSQPDFHFETSHAFLYDGTGMYDLGTLGGSLSWATAINDAGQIAGVSEIVPGGSRHAFLYDGAGLHDLGTLGGPSILPRSINAAGDIVGTANDRRDQARAFLYRNGRMYDLNDFLPEGSGWSQLEEANAINNLGQIVGTGYVGGHEHAFLLTPVPTPVARLSHDQTAFGGVAMGSTSDAQTVTVTNEGDAPLALGGVALTGADAADFAISADSGEGTLAPKATRTVSVRFTPAVPGVRTAVLVINDNAQGSPHGIALSGTGIGPTASISASTVSFGSQPLGTTSQGQDLTLTNTGTGLLTVADISLTGVNPTEFSIIAGGGATTLGPGASRTVTISFTPTDPGHRSADLIISDNAPGDRQRIAISGEGIAPELGVGAVQLWLGSLPVGATSDRKSIPLTNAGPGPVTISGVTLTGPGAADFAITSPGCVGVALAPGGGCGIEIVFTATVPGNRHAILTVTSNASNSPRSVDLFGWGLAPAISISPTTLDFGPQPLGTTNGAQAIIVQNSGDSPLDITRAAVTGANAADFIITADGWTGAHLLPGRIATLNIRFTPMAVGNRSASLTVTDNAPGGQQTVPLSGAGTTPTANLSAGSVSFSDQLVGTTGGEQSITLTNAGTAPLTVHGISLTGANPRDFVAPTDLGGATLAPGQSRAITVRFAPSGGGSRSASLVISDDAAGSPQLVALSGTGTAPSVNVGISRLSVPTTVSFGSQALGSANATKTITLTNSGTAPLTLSSVTLTGANAGDFALSADSGGATLAPGASRTLTLRFMPKAAGSRSATLRIVDNAAGSPHTIALAGTGVAPTPVSAEVFIVAVGGTASHSKQVTVSPGQGVSLQLLVRFKNGAVLDLTSDASSRLWADPARGQFTAKNTWSAKPADAGKKITLYGRYYPAVGRAKIVGQVSVTVRKPVRSRR